MKELDLILKNIKNKEVLPIYFFHGEEPYFIDLAVKALEHDFLTEDEKAFNQTVVYGKDTTYQEVLSLARQFPMMGDKQVIIVKEAQDLRLNESESNALEMYVQNPVPSTVLVFAHKHKKLDSRKKVTKALEKPKHFFKRINPRKQSSQMDCRRMYRIKNKNSSEYFTSFSRIFRKRPFKNCQ
jgi:DNA polymerase-3 subunit delta